MVVKALVMNEEDQVGTLIQSVAIGNEIHFYYQDRLLEKVTAAVEAISFGHKVARRDIAKNELVKKYGEPIGRSVRLIRAGEHVHVHNLTNPGSEPLPAEDEHSYFKYEELKRYASAIAEKCGASKAAAHHLADSLVEAELRGVGTHGLNRLSRYAKRIANGAVKGTAEPEVQVRGNIIRVDGNNAIDHHTASETVDRLIETAHSQHMAVAVVHNSNHFGFAGYYAAKIAEHNMIGIVTSNGTPCISVPNGKTAFFSNNPLAIAAKINEEEYVEMDVSLSVTSRGRVMQAWERNQSIPEGWANGPDGQPTTDPESGLQGSMNPLGGERGFALLFALEMLSGVLSGGCTADEVVSKDSGNKPEGTTHFFMALQVEAFLEAPVFHNKLIDLIQRMRQVPQTEGAAIPRYPGERRWRNRKRRLAEGIPLDAVLVQKLDALGHEMGVPFPQDTRCSQ